MPPSPTPISVVRAYMRTRFSPDTLRATPRMSERTSTPRIAGKLSWGTVNPTTAPAAVNAIENARSPATFANSPLFVAVVEPAYGSSYGLRIIRPFSSRRRLAGAGTDFDEQLSLPGHDNTRREQRIFCCGGAGGKGSGLRGRGG